jgi:very-long-chain (3R)-3-hydroxyacyl-CoA dehydratase
MPPKQQSTATKSKPKPPAGPLKTGYLILYNALSAAAWAAVLSRTVKTTIHSAEGPDAVFGENAEFTKWVQTGALLEVLHSLFGKFSLHSSLRSLVVLLEKLSLTIHPTGVVRAPLSSTVMQVASRILLVWGIGEHFPSAANHWAYATMLVAWSVTEVIRYSYFAFNLAASPPDILTWLRYNTFFILYPLGIASECWLINRSRVPAAQQSEYLEWGLWAILAIYVPGAYYLYSYMIVQRRKALRALKEKRL